MRNEPLDEFSDEEGDNEEVLNNDIGSVCHRILELPALEDLTVDALLVPHEHDTLPVRVIPFFNGFVSYPKKSTITAFDYGSMCTHSESLHLLCLSIVLPLKRLRLSSYDCVLLDTFMSLGDAAFATSLSDLTLYDDASGTSTTIKKSGRCIKWPRLPNLTSLHLSDNYSDQELESLRIFYPLADIHIL